MDEEQMDKLTIAGSGMPVAPKELGTVLSLRVPTTLAGQLRDAASARGCTVSDLLRDAALRLVGTPIGWRCDHMNISGPIVGRPSFGCGCDPDPAFDIADLASRSTTP